MDHSKITDEKCKQTTAGVNKTWFYGLLAQSGRKKKGKLGFSLQN